MPAKESAYRELMAGQLGIRHAQQFSVHTPIFNIGEYLEIRGDIDVALFGEAVRRTAAEADTSLLRICTDGEEVRQYFGPADLRLEVMDFTSAPDPQADARDWMWADMQRPIDLAEGPLVTHALLRVGPSLFFWYVRAHHIVADGYSGVLFVRRQAEIYASLLESGEPGGRPLESVSVLMDADAAYRRSAGFGEDREFWLSALAGLPEAVSISGRQPRPAEG